MSELAVVVESHGLYMAILVLIQLDLVLNDFDSRFEDALILDGLSNLDLTGTSSRTLRGRSLTSSFLRRRVSWEFWDLVRWLLLLHLHCLLLLLNFFKFFLRVDVFSFDRGLALCRLLNEVVSGVVWNAFCLISFFDGRR